MSILYENVILTLFVIVLVLVTLVAILLVIDLKKRKQINRMVSPRYGVSKFNRKGKLPMNEHELLELRKEILSKEKELKKIIFDEKRDVERQRKLNANLLSDVKGEVSKQKILNSRLKVGVAKVEADRLKLGNELKKELLKLEDKNVESKVQKKWHEEVDAEPHEGKEWLKKMNKKGL